MAKKSTSRRAVKADPLARATKRRKLSSRAAKALTSQPFTIPTGPLTRSARQKIQQQIDLIKQQLRELGAPEQDQEQQSPSPSGQPHSAHPSSSQHQWRSNLPDVSEGEGTPPQEEPSPSSSFLSHLLDTDDDASIMDILPHDNELPLHAQGSESSMPTPGFTGDAKMTQEQEYADDAYISRRAHDLYDQLDRFVQRFPFPSIPTPAYLLDHFLSCRENEQLIRFIDFVAPGGPHGKASWRECLVENPETRRAIIMGVLAKALKDLVFDDFKFGADQNLKEDLTKCEESLVLENEFTRVHARAGLIAQYEYHSSPGNHRSTDEQSKAIVKVCVQLGTLIWPLWAMEATLERWYADDIPARLHRIVALAADLNRELHRRGQVAVYQWSFPLKDEACDPLHMRSYGDYEELNEQHLQGRRSASGDPLDCHFLVNIICFPSLRVYRPSDRFMTQQLPSYLTQPSPSVLACMPPHWSPFKQPSAINAKDREQPPDACKWMYDKYEGFHVHLLVRSISQLKYAIPGPLTNGAGTSTHPDVRQNNAEQGHHENARDFNTLHQLFLEAQRLHQEEVQRRHQGINDWRQNVAQALNLNHSLHHA